MRGSPWSGFAKREGVAPFNLWPSPAPAHLRQGSIYQQARDTEGSSPDGHPTTNLSFPMSLECITPQEISDFSLQDSARLQGSIAKVLAQNTPWTNILSGGVLSNASRTIRSAVQEPAVLANSLTRPKFTRDVEMCEKSGTPDAVGSTEYTYELGSLRGKGPKVCVKEGRTAFLDSYTRAEESLKKGITRLFAADIKSTLFLRSGSKMVVNCSKNFYEMIGDSEQQAVDTPSFNGPTPS
jgi:hypothetical protein